jgi:hypothetical protein
VRPGARRASRRAARAKSRRARKSRRVRSVPAAREVGCGDLEHAVEVGQHGGQGLGARLPLDLELHGDGRRAPDVVSELARGHLDDRKPPRVLSERIWRRMPRPSS